MRVKKVINNNIVSSNDDNGEEVVIMGRGLGFHVKPGDKIDEKKVEKVFKLDDQGTTSKFKELLKAMPLPHIQISAEVIDYAKKIINRRLNQNIYITLTDHINFAITRVQNGMEFSNPLLWEVKHFYPSEYLIGEYAIALIEKELDITLREDEAASIALHIVNAEYDTAMGNTMKITSLIKEILQLVENYLGMKLDEESIHYSRFVTHLKFFSQRIFTNEMLNEGEVELSMMIQNLYPKEYECSQKIADYIAEKHTDYVVSEDEKAYLAVHIRRINMELQKIAEE